MISVVFDGSCPRLVEEIGTPYGPNVFNLGCAVVVGLVVLGGKTLGNGGYVLATGVVRKICFRPT